MALDLPTSWSHAKAEDEFTGRMLAAVNGMLAAVAHKDYEDRRRRQAEGNALVKAAGHFKGRVENRKRKDGIAAMLRAGSAWQEIQDAFRCRRSTVARVKKRLVAEQSVEVA